MNRPRAHSGFTLLELILVLLILAVAAAMVVPSLSNFALGRSTENTAQQILNLALYARSQCVSEARTYHMNFDTTAGQIWLTVGNSSGVFQPPPNSFGQKYTVPKGMKIAVAVTLQPNTQLVMNPLIVPTDAQPAPAFGQPVIPLVNTVMQIAHTSGTYIEFQSTGRTDPAIIKLTDNRGKEIDLGLATATEVMHRLTPAEMR
jgi:prepilin-type N-terminal cleavage/methylation domain-containing protein